MKKKKNILTAVFCVSVLLSACGNSLPNISDEQILELFGSRFSFSDHDTPLTISKNIEECARLLSGADADIYQDMPAEMLGSFKTSCRKNFQELLADKEKNPAGLTLKHMENRKLSERITRVRARSIEEAEAAKQAGREKEEAEKLAREQKKIAEAQEKLNLLMSSLDDRLKVFQEGCTVWQETYDALSKYNSIYLNKPGVCWKNYETELRDAAKNIAEQVSSLKPDNSFMGGAIPYFGIVDPEKLDQNQAALDEAVAKVKAALEKAESSSAD